MGQPSALITGKSFPLYTSFVVQRTDEAVDEGLRGALIRHGFEQFGKLANGEPALHPVILGHHVLQIALGGGGLAAGLLDDPMRLVLAELGRERERDRLGHDASPRLGEVDPHARFVDFEPFRNVDDGIEGA
jgi:hypothetical protein